MKNPFKKRNIMSFFKPIDGASSNEGNSQPNVNEPSDQEQPLCVTPSSPIVASPQVTSEIEIDVSLLERDPALRKPILEYHPNQRDEVRRAYIEMGPYQPNLPEYKAIIIGLQNRRFQRHWFNQWNWLEYSPSSHKAYCFPCFLFQSKPGPFVSAGFNYWKRVNDGERCAFLTHVGPPNSPHHNAANSVCDLSYVKGHIDKVMNREKTEEVKRNRLRLKATIESIRWLSLQACALRGHDESATSKNRGNLIEMVKLMGKMNDEINDIILEKAPLNAQYVSPPVQKDILGILSDIVKKKIREEIGNAKFNILVDEAKDVSSKEQMAIVVRFVDVEGFIRERFFDIVEVADTTALTLKASICDALGKHNLQIHDIRGQGYDGASNMRGSWNGLQALFLRDSPQAYYVHCFAHRLQLALVGAAENEVSVWQFFSKLNSIVNLITGSPKRVAELHSCQAIEVERMLRSGERVRGRGANQMGNLQRAGRTRWSSHYDSICSVVDMYGAVIMVLKKILCNGATSSIRGEAAGNLNAMRSFDFVFILYLMHKIMGITYLLCQALQAKTLDILNAMACVSTTKELLQGLRDGGFDVLLMIVKDHCTKYGIEIPNMETCFKSATGRSCQQTDNISVEHHYLVDVFYATIDFQIQEINSRFNDDAVELLQLSAALEPRNNFELFDTNCIYALAEKFYPADFDEQDMKYLKLQLEHYKRDVTRDKRLQNLSTISELCRRLFETKKSVQYNMIDRLIRLILTLPVSTASTERAFSAMKLVKTVLRNKMGADYLADSMVIFIEREFAQSIDCDLVIDEFYKRKFRRSQLQ